MENGTGSSRVKAHLDPELRAEFEAIAAQAGCELVHAEWKGGTLRVFVDRPEGVNLEDCEQVSKQISALLDVLDFGNVRYVLEVSSPGLDRQLYGPRDYERFVGRKVRVTYSTPEIRKRTVVARLEEWRPDTADLTLLEEESGARTTLKLDQVQLARLEVEL